MARIVAFVPDLLFGSKVIEAIRAAGHEPELVTDAGGLARLLPGASAVIADLTADAPARLELVREAGVPVLAFYSHVDGAVRELAQAAGVALIVPRSRMAREGAALVARLLVGASRERP